MIAGWRATGPSGLSPKIYRPKEIESVANEPTGDLFYFQWQPALSPTFHPEGVETYQDMHLPDVYLAYADTDESHQHDSEAATYGPWVGKHPICTIWVRIYWDSKVLLHSNTIGMRTELGWVGSRYICLKNCV